MVDILVKYMIIFFVAMCVLITFALDWWNVDPGSVMNGAVVFSFALSIYAYVDMHVYHTD